MAHVRTPAVAGSFYPRSESRLRQTIKDFFKKAHPPKDIPASRIKATIVPHAGYFYSGLTAAFAYKIISKVENKINFILLGPSHLALFDGAAQDTSDHWETPLGNIKIKLLPEESPIISSSEPHIQEHCLEVQLPFLQVIFKEFTITPIVISENCDFSKLATVLKPHLSKETILVISSDLSHYYSQHMAKKIDRATIEQIQKLNNKELVERKYEACGKTAILTAIELAKSLNWRPELLHYETSAAASSDTSRVVGYASMVFLSSEK